MVATYEHRELGINLAAACSYGYYPRENRLKFEKGVSSTKLMGLTNKLNKTEEIATDYEILNSDYKPLHVKVADYTNTTVDGDPSLIPIAGQPLAVRMGVSSPAIAAAGEFWGEQVVAQVDATLSATTPLASANYQLTVDLADIMDVVVPLGVLTKIVTGTQVKYVAFFTGILKTIASNKFKINIEFGYQYLRGPNDSSDRLSLSANVNFTTSMLHTSWNYLMPSLESVYPVDSEQSRLFYFSQLPFYLENEHIGLDFVIVDSLAIDLPPSIRLKSSE